MRTFKVGDSITYNGQIGTVVNLDGPAPYQVEVSFENGTEDCFTLEGLQHVTELQKQLTHTQASLAMLAACLVITMAWTLSIVIQAKRYHEAYDSAIETAEGFARTRTGAINNAYSCHLINPTQDPQ